MYKLFLDDQRFPQTSLSLIDKDFNLYLDDSEWVIARDYNEFTSIILEQGVPSYVSFDHDLADIRYLNGKMTFSYKPETGFDCAEWLYDYCKTLRTPFPSYQVHSANYKGKRKIEEFLLLKKL